MSIQAILVKVENNRVVVAEINLERKNVEVIECDQLGARVIDLIQTEVTMNITQFVKQSMSTLVAL